MKLFRRMPEILLRMTPLAVIVAAVLFISAAVSDRSETPVSGSLSVIRVDGQKLPASPLSDDPASETGSLFAAVPCGSVSSVISRRPSEPPMPRLLRDSSAYLCGMEDLQLSGRFCSEKQKHIPLFIFQCFLRRSLPPRAGPQMS